MKKFKTFFPLAFIGICAFTASTSCDSGDPQANENSELTSLFSGQSRGIDPAVVASNPQGDVGLPFSLIPGDTITFQSGGAQGAGPALTQLILKSPNTLEQLRSGNFQGDESAYTQTWSLVDGARGTTHSDATKARISLHNQHLWPTLGATGANLPPGYVALYESTTNTGSLNAAVREFRDGTLSPDQFNTRQLNALNSINIFSFIEPTRTTEPERHGPMVRVQQFIDLEITSGVNTNAGVSQSRQITGEFTYTQTYYQIANESLGEEADDGAFTFDPEVFVIAADTPEAIIYEETGTFTINLSSITLP